MKKRLIGLLLGYLVITAIAPGQIQVAQARPFVTPLVILLKGDLWTWTGDLATPANGTLTQLTHHGYNHRPILSPDGTRVAYKSLADIAISTAATDVDKSTAFANGPSNMWVWDLTNGQAKRIAEQPGTVSRDQTGEWHDAFLRSDPTWSPDSTKVAWVEATLPGLAYRLMVYDFATDTSTAIVPNLPTPFSDASYIGMPDPLWGPAGLALYIVHGAQTGLVGETLLYDSQGSQLLSVVQKGPGAYVLLWITDAGKDYLGLQQADGSWILIDPSTKQSATISSVSLDLYNPAAADSTYSVVYRFRDINNGDWTVADNTGTEMPLSFTAPMWGISSLAVAPSGQAVAYSTTALYIWYNGKATQVPGTEGLSPNTPWPDNGALVWGVGVWRLRPLGAG